MTDWYHGCSRVVLNDCYRELIASSLEFTTCILNCFTNLKFVFILSCDCCFFSLAFRQEMVQFPRLGPISSLSLHNLKRWWAYIMLVDCRLAGYPASLGFLIMHTLCIIELCEELVAEASVPYDSNASPTKP